MSGVIFRDSVPARAVIQAFMWGEVLSSHETRNELRDVVGRSKFDRYVAREFRMQVIEDILQDTRNVTIRQRVQVCRDPSDDIVLELAINGRADVIITGDKDLLVLHPFRGIPIVTPLDYLAM